MLLTVKLVGTGKPGNEYGVNLPTYRLIHGNVTRGTALVDVPDHTHDLTTDDLQHEEAEQTTDGVYYPKLCDECVKKINDSFDQRYQEHAGKFRVERG